MTDLDEKLTEEQKTEINSMLDKVKESYDKKDVDEKIKAQIAADLDRQTRINHLLTKVDEEEIVENQRIVEQLKKHANESQLQINYQAISVEELNAQNLNSKGLIDNDKKYVIDTLTKMFYLTHDHDKYIFIFSKIQFFLNLT